MKLIMIRLCTYNMNEWFKEWETVGYTHDPNFMKHPGNEFDSPSRVFVREFITENSLDSVTEIGCGPLVELQYFIQGNLLLKKYTGYDVNRYQSWETISMPEWATVHQMETPYKIAAKDYNEDFVYTRHTLEHQENHIEFIKELHRICKEKLLITFFIPPSNENSHKTEMWKKFYCKTYSKPILLDEFTRIGFDFIESYDLIGKNSNDVAWLFSHRVLDKKS